MNEVIDKYSYIWNGTDPGWVLVLMPRGGYSIFHEKRKALLHLDDKLIKEEIVIRMKEAGLPLVDSFPRE